MSSNPAVTLGGSTVPLSPQEAFRAVVHEFGVEEMAAALLMNVGTLHNKCNAADGSQNRPSLNDVVSVTRISGNSLILESLDRLFGRAGYEVTPGAVNDTALMELLCRIASENGAMHQAFNKSLLDGKFCRDDLADVRAEAFDVISAVLSFLQRLEGLVDA